ncbi:F-box/LRR-repeat protein At3g59200-like [Miscanthus floridulus]|uniref:F-box/LRR-repeat protein At3g59200-like n=1 Tax=Miscanthus floridulus TaxID=154761 RepID=UPI00345851D1
MLPGESSNRAVPPALGSRGSIDALPDGVLEHILGFLLAPEAVRTCVLARRWRHLWMSAPGLRVGCVGNDVQHDPPRVEEYRELVDRLLLLRRGSPLDTCDIRLGMFKYDDVPRLNAWFWHIISCKVRLLTLRNHWAYYLVLHDLPLVSKHLTRLELRGVWLPSSFLDFSSCPALEYLELFTCILLGKNILSDSLKHLSITDSQCHGVFCTCIYAPNLVSLRLDGLQFSSPTLDSMPSLVEAFVRITEDYENVCDNSSETDILDCLCESCDSARGATGNGCVLFKGLSEAKSLVLTCTAYDSVLFKWDLKCCPAFSKLKSLVLNEYWCVPDDFGPLVCILQLSPVLEELSLELFSEGPKYEVDMKGSISPMERSATISEHLNVVKVKCQAVDERVLEILKLLCTFNIRFDF